MAALATALLLACGGQGIERGPTPTPVLPVTTVRIGDHVILAEVPHAPQDRARGLAERDFLPRDRGMLFVFDFEHPHAFWMRGMRFPLDFVWISADRRVVEVTTEVPPQAGVPEAELRLHRPRAAVLYVLEVNSGVVEELGIRVGDRVEFTLPPGRGQLSRWPSSKGISPRPLRGRTWPAANMRPIRALASAASVPPPPCSSPSRGAARSGVARSPTYTCNCCPPANARQRDQTQSEQ